VAAEALGVPEPFATNIARFRFPLGPVDRNGDPAERPSTLDGLRTLGHGFRRTPTIQGPVRRVLTDVERARFRASLIKPGQERCLLRVRWIRSLHQPGWPVTGTDNTQLNEYAFEL